MTLRLNGSTSGYVELDSPATGDSSTILLPTGGNGTLGRMQLATAQNTTSGTSIDFTGIPSWVKRVTVMFNGVSTNGTANILVRIGSGSVDTSGYVSYVNSFDTVPASTTATDGILVTRLVPAASASYGSLNLTLLGSNAWVGAVMLTGDRINIGNASKTLSGTLDRIRITTTNGTDTFDAGSINILYEG